VCKLAYLLIPNSISPIANCLFSEITQVTQLAAEIILTIKSVSQVGHVLVSEMSEFQKLRLSII
jgi:hypothetical protein